MFNFYAIDKTNLIIIILGILIIFLFIFALLKNIKKLRQLKKDKKKDLKAVVHNALVISKREYITKDNEKYYYVTFLINEDEKELIVPKDNYRLINVDQVGELTLLQDKVFLDFIIV